MNVGSGATSARSDGTRRETAERAVAIDLIALDLDGTLLDASEGVSLANRHALAAARARGVHVVLVTGRGVDAVARLGDVLDLDQPAVCAHGALVKDVRTGRTVAHRPVPLADARELLAFAQATQSDVAVYQDEHFYHQSGCTTYMDDQRGSHWREVPSLLEAIDRAPTMLRFLGGAAVRRLRENFDGDGLHFKYETWGAFEECAITHAEASKERALADLCADLGVASARVLALGDSCNDVPMLRWAGFGVAMGNARPEVRAAVGYVTDPCERDGVASAIARFVLAGLERSA